MAKKHSKNITRNTPYIVFTRLVSATPRTIAVVVVILVLLGCTTVSALYMQRSKESNTGIATGTSTSKKSNGSAQVTPKATDATAPSNTTPSEATATTKASSNSTKSAYKPYVCQNVPIPYQTNYVNESSMAVGTSKVISQGTDGYYVLCTADSTGYIPPTNGMRVEPVNAIVFQGTGPTQAQIDAAQAQRDQTYLLAMTNCVQNLKQQGVSDSMAQQACQSQIHY